MAETISNKPKVLIIDDVSENIHGMMNILGDTHAVTAATSGEKGLVLAGQRPQPELILLDIRMPDMDGYEVIRKLKRNPATADIPVLFVTALADSEDEAKGLKMGAADYITKPVNPDLLKTRVMAQLELLRYRRKTPPSILDDDRVSMSNLSILVVDDVPENVHDLVSALSDDYRIMVATNGPKAIELVQAPNPPDLILMDIMMPDMDGYETCRRIKATGAGLRIPIIFLSIIDKPFEKVRGFSLGAADYIAKPFDIDEARARISTHLQLSRLQLYFEEQVAQRTAALEAAKNQLQATLGAIPDFMFELNLEGHCLNAHTPRHQLPAASQDDLVGKQISQIFPPEAVAVCMAGLNEANEKGWSFGKQVELPLARENGWFELSIARKETSSESDPRFIVLSRDITQRKHVEAELKKHRQHLEELVKERTTELETKNAELQRFNKLFVDRELRIKELKDKVKKLEEGEK